MIIIFDHNNKYYVKSITLLIVGPQLGKGGRRRKCWQCWKCKSSTILKVTKKTIFSSKNYPCPIYDTHRVVHVPGEVALTTYTTIIADTAATTVVTVVV